MKTKILLAMAALALSVTPSFAADDTGVEALNTLLVGEMSAVDTYNQALEKVGQEDGADLLKMHLSDHEKAVKNLKTAISSRGGVPATSTGAWGTWAETVVGSAKILGDEAALKALKEGEEHGFDEYNEALKENHLNTAEKEMVKNDLIPAQQRHIKNLDMLMMKK